MSDTTYQEYQYWFHAYNNAITALSDTQSTDLINQASLIADRAVEKFKDIKIPETPGLDMSGIQDMMKSAAAAAMSSTSKSKKNR